MRPLIGSMTGTNENEPFPAVAEFVTGNRIVRESGSVALS